HRLVEILAVLDGDKPGSLVRVAVADDHDRSVRVLDPDPRMDGVLAATDEILHPRRQRPHATNLRIWSIVQPAPRSTTASRHAAGAGLAPFVRADRERTWLLHAAVSPTAADRADTVGVPPLIACSIWTEPSG